jgi:tellurite resistance protein TerC
MGAILRMNMSILKASIWSVIWVTLSIAFCCLIYFKTGSDSAITYLSGYLVEKMLSIDNLFVFYMIFSYFKTPKDLQVKALSWGIIGAFIFRAIMIFTGCAVINKFEWVLYLFGCFLLFTGLKLSFVSDEDEEGPSKIIQKIRSFLPGISIFVLTIITIEISDVIFALDSIPAIFGITTDPFIVYTSNIFAIMGLRSLYFLILGLINKFHYLPNALSIILSFIGIKMLIKDWVNVSIFTSFGVITGVMITAIILSIIKTKRNYSLEKTI